MGEILANPGEMKLEVIHNMTIPALKRTAEESQDQMKFQEVNDMIQFADRLDRRIHDLKLCREITIQSAPQIRLIQNTNQALFEKNPVIDRHGDSALEKPGCHCSDID